MTVSTTTSKVSYNGNGSTTVFAYTFKVFDEDDLTVILRDDTTGTETTQTISTNYTVSGVGNTSGGNVTFVTAPASGKTVVIRRESAQTQTTDYTPNDPFPAEAHEDALDKLTFIAQEVQEGLDRAIKLSRTNTMTSTEFTVGASDRANKLLAFDSSGEIAVTQEIGTFVGNWSTGTAFNERDIVKDTSTNNIFIANTAHTSSGSQPLTTNTDSAKWDLIVDASSASTSSSTASDHRADAGKYATTAHNTTFTLTATNGGTSGLYSALHYATESANSATASSSSATAASSSATAAAGSATAAALSAAAAAASADDFTDRYYGAHADDSAAQTYITGQGLTVDAGDLYFDSTNDIMRVYSGSVWQDVAVSSAGLLTVANNLSDLNSAATALTNLGLTATAAELNTLDGITSTVAELNILDGVTATFTEINYNDITTLGTVEASKTVTADSNGEITVPDDKKIYFGTNSDASIKYDETTDDRLKIEGAQVEFAKSVLGSTNTDTTNTGNVTLDFAANQNHVLTLTGNVTLVNPTTEQVGQSGFIVFIQDATGGRTVSLGTDYETAGGAGITLSTAASTTDVVPYIVVASGRILLGTPQLAFS